MLEEENGAGERIKSDRVVWYGCWRKSLPIRWYLSRELKRVRGEARRGSGRRQFQADGKASAELVRAACVRMAWLEGLRRSEWLDWESKGKNGSVKCQGWSTKAHDAGPRRLEQGLWILFLLILESIVNMIWLMFLNYYSSCQMEKRLQGVYSFRK